MADLNLEHQNNFLPKRQAPIKRCPKCQSIYVEDGTCQSCHFNLEANPLGIPFNEKSFYSIKEAFLDSLPKITLLYPFIQKIFYTKEGDFKKRLLERLFCIRRYFTDPLYQERSVKDRHLYFIELKEIISELLDYKVNPYQILKRLLLENSSDIAPIVQEAIHFLKEEVSLREKEKKEPFKIRRKQLIVYIILMPIFLSILAILFASYFRLSFI